MKSKILILVFLITNVVFSQNFHDTQGKLDITSSGQATYTLPIAMPPSIKDVGPVINLVYASGQMGGIAGQGWNINSISNISRIATRQDIDGFKDGVDFDDNDKLALDGQRLLLKTGTYWADGSTYETEVQSNTKIELKETGAGIYFIVTTPDGSRTWYGNYGGVNATDLNAFYVVRFEDTFGNFMTYHYNLTSPNNAAAYSYEVEEIIGYDSDGRPEYGMVTYNMPAILSSNSITIAEIKFSGNTVTNPTALNSIKFTYKLASRTNEKGFLKGEKIQNIDILDKIEVFTNSLLFKKYQLTHITDANGYQRVTQLQEFNGAGEPANPVLFEYKKTFEGASENSTNYNDNYNATISPDLSGDFDGDSHLDFISSGQVYTNLFNGSPNPGISLPFTSTGRQMFSATTLSDASTPFVTGYKLNQKQSLVNANETTNSISFNVYNYNNATIPYSLGFSNSYTKTIPFDNGIFHDTSLDTYNSEICRGSGSSGGSWNNCYDLNIKKSNIYLEGDYNGDGISEVLITSKKNERYYNDELYIFADGYDCTYDSYRCDTFLTDDGEEFHLFNLDPRASTTLGESGFVKLSDNNLFKDGKKFVMDFNSDGKSDILCIKPDGSYKIIGFKQLFVTPWVELETIGIGSIPHYSTTKQILFGDYNGDGKPDIMLPNSNGGEGHNLWHIYYSNPNPAGGNFFTVEDHYITEYAPVYGTSYYGIYNNYFAMDTNKDGKTDLVKVRLDKYRPCGEWGTCGSNRDTKWRVYNYTNNIGGSGSFNLDYVSPSDHWSDDNSLPIVIASGYKRDGINNEMVVIRYHGNGSFDRSSTFIKFNKNINEDNLLLKVTQSDGAVVDDIAYSQMVPELGVNNGLGSIRNFYSSTESLLYPMVELKQMPTNWLVAGIQNTSLGVQRYQMFRYHGFSVNLNGSGVVGFKKTARSSWFNAQINNKIIWNATENDPLKRGAMIRSYTQKLLTTEYFEYNTTLPLINKSENVFTQNTDPISKRYTLLLNKQTSTDYLKNTVTEKIYNTYSPDYFLPTQVTVNNYLGTILQGSTTTTTVFDNSILGTGNNYYIGRPKETTTKTTAYGDTKFIKEKYFYNNGNIIKTEKNANNDAITLIEDYDYFSNGLLKSKKISATGTTIINAVSPKNSSITYDATNRFVKTTTDTEGLVTTNLTYHPLYGTVLTQKNPFRQVTTSIIDNWGKQTKVTDFLGKSINYSYTRTNNIYTTTQTGDDGSGSTIESDALARVFRKGSKNLNGIWNYVNSEYNYLDQKIRDSEPYTAGTNPTQWNTFEYDDYSRNIKSIAHTGKTVTTIYNGLTVTANDGTMTKTKTMNANGHVVSATDNPGGTILYKYDALGNLIESDYEGIKSTIQYDNWGQKVELIDTSAGRYTYSYNAFGQPITEGTPKGITTYTYTPVGKLLTKSVVGLTSADGTNITSTYSYDPTYKWLTDIKVVNPNDGNSRYTYSYDAATKQINKTIEELYLVGATNPFATFTKIISFDNFGRVDKETSTALSHGKTSSKIITHAYKNGAEWQLLEGTKVLWQANTVNARGQLLTGTLGNGITINNSYDSYGYHTQAKHDLGTTNIMTLNNVFEPILGNLTQRYNSMFDTRENFTYDTLDRLITWNGSDQNLLYLPFNTTTEGFIGISTGSASNVFGKMKVNLNSPLGSLQRTLPTIVVSTGQSLRIKTTVINKSGTAGVVVNVMMVETDPLDANNTNEVFVGVLENGIFDVNYTVSSFVPNPKLSLKFVIDEFSPTSSNGGGIVFPRASFTIDDLSIDTVNNNSQNYDERGRIRENNLGEYNYTNEEKPYQNTSVITTPEADAYYSRRKLQEIKYNAFKAPIEINEEGKDIISFGYNTNEQRQIMYYGSTNADKMLRPYRRYYSADGSMEVTATFATGSSITPTIVEFITYIGGDGYTAPIVNKTTFNATTPTGAGGLFYLHRDYQGSIMAITNSVGAVIESRLYDPWGQILKLKQNGVLTPVPSGAGLFFDRGYTGHEHLLSVGLINMNARLYDPKLHRFLQPDALIQDPYNTQNYNRYGYCINNPLKYTDISGNDFGISTAITVAVIVAVGSYLAINCLTDQPITFEGVITSAVVGAISGAVTFGIGSAFTNVGNFYLKAVYSALAHGAFQGSMTAIQGGNFWNGFAAGSLASLASSAWEGGSSFKTVNGVTEQTAKHAGISGALKMGKTAGTLVFGTIAGGAGAALTGGNFWQGAVTGLIVAAANHVAHQMGENSKPKIYREGFFREMQKEFNQTTPTFDSERVSKVLNSLGLGTDAKMAIMSLAKGELTAISGYLKGMKVLSGILGGGAITLAAVQYYNNPTTANLLGLVGTTATVAFAGPIGSFAVGLADMTGASNYVYGQLGSMIDNIAGYSVGNALHDNISSLFNFNLAKP